MSFVSPSLRPHSTSSASGLLPPTAPTAGTSNNPASLSSDVPCAKGLSHSPSSRRSSLPPVQLPTSPRPNVKVIPPKAVVANGTQISAVGLTDNSPMRTCMAHLTGKGFDSTIISTVLRDIVTADLQVTFEDIASLDTAKRLLHETVTLPLLLPEYFTGIRAPWKVGQWSYTLDPSLPPHQRWTP